MSGANGGVNGGAMGRSVISRVMRALGLARLTRSAASVHRTRGDEARDSGDWPRAAEHYRQYVAAQPDAFPIWVQLGHALKEAGEWAEAEQAYRRAEAIRPGDPDLALNLGHLMKSTRRRAEATRCYQRSFDLDGNLAARSELEALGVTPERNLTERRVGADRPMVGAVDRVDGIQVRGWAVEPERATGAARVEVVTEAGRVIGTGVATQVRADLAAAGISDGPSGFTLFVDADDLAGETILADVRLKSTGDLLDGSPLPITLPSSAEANDTRRVSSARCTYAKPLEQVTGEHAIFVAYAATGMVQPFVRRFLRMLAAEGITVSLVVNADRPVLLDDDLLDLVGSAMVRENKGYDFGAWAHQLRLEPRLFGAEALYIINDSIFGPSAAAPFAETIAAIRANPADLVGLTESLERGWHLQSYFLRVSGALLSSYAFQLFVNSVRVIADKDEIINAYEVPLSERVCAAGFTADSIFKVDEARNPTLFAWERLLEAGFPFVKLLLVRGRFPEVNTKGIKKTLERLGFDRSLLDATLRYGAEEALPDAGYPLLARPRTRTDAAQAKPARPYKVAFYGPWNYDNGLGSASRGIIAAIRQTGVRLNLHPIRKPFHIHKPLSPAHDVTDFDGPADVAIIHLNPDSWLLLTDEQRIEISRARRRIGYWVWEMEQLPPGWRREFSSVDRIWAPSGYNAALFAAEDEAPVDTIPHVVAVPADLPGDPMVIRSALNLPIDRRMILYVFDGASYLVRKNPAALIRAFAASDLAAAGWCLVLKTKHLMDRPEEGVALAALAQSVAGVILLDRSLSDQELSNLVASCDIYASPHCAEGFGLTVAEAMAAGRVVVATDYSGTTQFLDEGCGYPVRATSWTLDEDFGHYTTGGTWARIDEQALAEALSDAAAHVESGEGGIGRAARTRVAEQLSATAVGAAISASLDAVLAEKAHPGRPMIRIEPSDTGISLDSVAQGTGLSVQRLAGHSLTPREDGLAAVANDRDAWLMIAPKEGSYHPLTVRLFERAAASRPDVALFHGDDVALGEPDPLDQIRLKPDFDRTMFAAQDYIGAPLFIRGSVLHELGGLQPALGDAALYDLVLRVAERGMSIGRIAEVLLVQPGQRAHAPLEARQMMIGQSPLYAGCDVRPGDGSGLLQLEPRFPGERPHVSLCIPTRRSAVEEGGGSYVERLLKSLSTVDWPMDRLTVIIGDDVPGVPDWAEAAWPFLLHRIETPRGADEPFNFAAKMNRLWRMADSETVVLLNDDVVAVDPDWLGALVGFACNRSVGAVGPRLLYDDGTVQHAGIYGGVLGTSVHAWLGRRAGSKTYQNWGVSQRELSMITGAVMATRRSVLEAVNGFDERFSLEFNDIDLCLKIRQLGLRIVYNPAAELIHSEKKSRGETPPPGEQLALFLSRWQRWLDDDPALPPRMRRDTLDLTPCGGPANWFV